MWAAVGLEGRLRHGRPLGRLLVAPVAVGALWLIAATMLAAAGAGGLGPWWIVTGRRGPRPQAEPTVRWKDEYGPEHGADRASPPR
ncbi:hypothetical protein [Yonghaparkia sp. Soil809]|uniref:hypothetical protein n=1 Tax=Yonghaparkia sp. Soil809 TaxID=1736417 RepID=UPI0006F844C6|nr:hypothetical protein [Yonghaparkia sp. Soil809]KRF30784.1 hypothetical protein ASG83_07895 [Yonghaparkia sp. Soil809]